MGIKDVMKSTLAAVLAVGVCMSATGGLQPVQAEGREIVYTNEDRAFLANKKYYGDIWYDGEYKKNYGEKNDFFTYYIKQGEFFEEDTLVIDYWVSNGQDILFVPDTVDGIKIFNVSFENVVAKNIVLADGIEEVCGAESETIYLGANYDILGNNSYRDLDCKHIKVSKKNKKLKSINGVLFSKNGKELKYYPSKRQNARYIIPKGTKRIGKDAFAYLHALEEIVIPSSVKHIEEKAFYDSYNLEKFVLKGKKTVLPIDSGFIYIVCEEDECVGGCEMCVKEVTVKVPARSVMRKTVKDKNIKYVTTKK